jgi:flagellar biosynthetic protein FlhB
MIDDVRLAKLVVVDGDRVAVALGYDPVQADAPVILAKGERLVAGMIREVAQEASVPMWADATLAEALREVEPGDELPESAFDAVAKLLALVDKS